MGQKVHPFGFRLGYNKNWQSRWFSKKDYPAFVFEDSKIRAYVKRGWPRSKSNAPVARSV